MAILKMRQIKNRTPLQKTNFSLLETLSLGPKRFLHSKGPKNGICLVFIMVQPKTKSIFRTFRVKESFGKILYFEMPHFQMRVFEAGQKIEFLPSLIVWITYAHAFLANHTPL